MKRLFALLVLLAPASAADLYPVAGVVTNALTNSPIPHAQVYLFRTGTRRPNQPFIAGENGRFSFNVPEGSYTLHAGTRNGLENYGENNPDSPLGSAVIAGPGKDTAHLVFKFYPTGSISGKVLDDAGEPVENALLQLVRSSVVAGRRVTTTARWERTNDRGEYRFGGIPGGARYYITVTGEPWYEKGNAWENSSPAASVAYLPVYYPNTTEASHALPLALKAGGEEHADFTMRPAAGATLRVSHDAPQGSTGMVSLIYKGLAGTDSFQQQQTLMVRPGRAMAQNLSGVPPGTYTVRVTANNGGTELMGTKEISVNGSEVAVEIALHPVASVSGRLQFKEPTKKPAGSVVLVLTRPGTTYTASVREDGSFRFSNVMPGKYQAGLRSPAGYVVASATAARTDGGVSVEVAEGDQVSLALAASDETGNLEGFAKSGEQAIGGVMVVLAPAPGEPAGRLARAFQTESDGSYDLRNVPAGKYLLFAIEDTGIEYATAEAVRPFPAGAKPVTIEAHKSLMEDVVLTVKKP
jgi:hypothetical protein